MHRSRWLPFHILSAALGLVAFSATSIASAYHTEEQRITDRTAYTMPCKSFRFGLFETEYAALDSVGVRTIWPLWLLLVPNLEAKWRLYGRDPVALALSAGVVYLDTRILTYIAQDIVDARIVTIPLELSGSHRFNRMHTANASIVFTPVFLDGTVDTDAVAGIGRGVAENLQMTGTYEIRASRVTAFQITGRVVLHQRARASTETVYHPDEYTTVEVFGGASGAQDELVGKGSLVTDAVFSWKTWNLRTGLGYGHYNVPGFNFVAGEPGPLLSFDLYWIWR